MIQPGLISSVTSMESSPSSSQSRAWVIPVLVLAGVTLAAWRWSTTSSSDSAVVASSQLSPVAVDSSASPQSAIVTDRPEDASYEAARAAIETRRQQLAKIWAQTSDVSKKQAVITEACRVFAGGVAQHLAPWWQGTPWDFNGVTQVPGQGKIACGYYVSTLLQHAGLQVERVRLAQQASLHIIQTLIGSDALVKGHGVPLATFVDRIRARGAGIYVVGLDNHTGFLWHDGTEVWFMHSNFTGPRCVVKERAAESAVLGKSNYRVAGCLTSNDALMQAWLEGRHLATRQPASSQ